MAYTKYSLTPANNTAAPPDGAPEGMLPSAVNDTMRDMMAQIRDVGDGIRDGTYTMTAPKITGGTITGAAFTGNTFTSPVISGGTINNATIGATTATTGKFTTLEATGVATFSAGAVGTPAITTTGDTNTGIYFPAADTIAFTEGGAESMRINSSGNVGIGVVPSAWSGATALQVGSGGAFFDFGSSNVVLGSNVFFNGTNNLYINTDSASYYQQSNGVHIWATAASGTAGNIISFSESMRIDSSGNVGIGTTSGGKLNVAGNFSKNTGDENTWGIRVTDETAMAAGVGGGMVFVGNYTSGGGKASFGGIAGAKENATTSNGLGQLRFYTTDVSSILQERMRITSSGNLLVGTTAAISSGFTTISYVGTALNGLIISESANTSDTSFLGFNNGATNIGSVSRVGATSAVIYSTTSDERLKSNIADANPVLDKLMDVKVRQFDWTEGNLHQDAGFIAQELAPVLSGIVTKGKTEEDMWQLDYSRLTPYLVKAIQEQQALIENLTTRLNALEGN